MAVYVVTGKLGGGKTLVSVSRILATLEKKCVVATNLDLNLEKLVSPFNKTVRVIRIPDKPSIFDMETIGVGNESYDEEKNGLLVLDECGTWFNSRNWQDKARKPVNDWFLHARKLGWDVILIIQDVSNLDSQARSSIAEHTVFCRRTDRLAVPFLSTFIKTLTGFRLKLPKVHIGRVVYGISESDLLVDRWVYRGTGLYAAYDTKQLFLEDYKHGPHSLLPPFYTHGRYMAERTPEFYMRLTKIYWKRFQVPVALAAGFLLATALTILGVFLTQYDPQPTVIYMQPEETGSEGISQEENKPGKDPVMKRLKHMYIKSFAQYDSTISYGLAYHKQPEGKEYRKEVQLHTRKLQDMGYQVEPVTECKAVISNQDQSVPVYCF